MRALLKASHGKPIDKSLLGGIRFIRSNRLLLAAHLARSFSPFLLGGVTALLPIYATDILAIGPAGLGWLRCAPRYRCRHHRSRHGAPHDRAPRRRRVDAGLCRRLWFLPTVVFALSTNFLAVACRLWSRLGGFDMVSMVIRHTLVQIATPDTMARPGECGERGVLLAHPPNWGEFESGTTAALFGTRARRPCWAAWEHCWSWHFGPDSFPNCAARTSWLRKDRNDRETLIERR